MRKWRGKTRTTQPEGKLEKYENATHAAERKGRG